MKRLHESGLFYFTKNGDNVRVWFTTIPQCVRRYEVEPFESGRKIPNIMVRWDFREGDKLHIYLAENVVRTFVAKNGIMTEELVVNYGHNFDDCGDDELLHHLGLLNLKYEEKEKERNMESALLDMSRKKE